MQREQVCNTCDWVSQPQTQIRRTSLIDAWGERPKPLAKHCERASPAERAAFQSIQGMREAHGLQGCQVRPHRRRKR